jgi:hypothetical protein
VLNLSRPFRGGALVVRLQWLFDLAALRDAMAVG